MEILSGNASPRLPIDALLRRRRRILCTLAAIFAAAVPGFAAPASEARVYEAAGHSEDSVKAAYLYRFTQYIEWPTAPASTEPFTIAVLNAPGVAEQLGRLLPDHPIKNSVAQVRVITRVSELGHAQMLYLGATPPGRLRSLIESIAFGPVLLVTDSEEGLELGSELNFVIVENRVRFEVSLAAADKSRFRISSELLAVAARVRGGSRQSDGTHLDNRTVMRE
jgi:hypothetical protein